MPALKSDVLLLAEIERPLFPNYLLAGLSVENLKSLCVSLLHRYTSCSNLPVTNNSYMRIKVAWLIMPCNARSPFFIYLKSYFLPSMEDDNALTQAQSLWAYAIFSATILFDIGRIVSDLEVKIYDRNNHFIKNWLPFEGSLLSQGQFL